MTTLLCEMNTFTHVREMGDRSLYVSLQQESLQSELVNVGSNESFNKNACYLCSTGLVAPISWT